MTEFLLMLSALSHETRLETFRLLVTEMPLGLPAGEIARRLGTVSTTMSTHLGILERARLIASRRTGRSIIYTASLGTMQELIVYLLKDCCKGDPTSCATVTAMLATATAPGEAETAPIQN
ncbi:transcriptional regulator [Aureimonas sp. SA4125]|uniref:ArsR/SmtB family transcription factor n=1 Tax=Aureimonas sp. SA4125 TaxID=2826993 RepID=UPI001CC3D2B8|nr:metalloregulator ArsR/SmtB family transcription factor [Aureimonas sp. SA4125]BDA84328.1 transcriptional regulator [Aureimonas sp. SA4125]